MTAVSLFCCLRMPLIGQTAIGIFAYGFFMPIYRKEPTMKLTEPEMRMAYQLESTSQAGVLNELYMTCRYSRDEDTKATAESLMAKSAPSPTRSAWLW